MQPTMLVLTKGHLRHDALLQKPYLQQQGWQQRAGWSRHSRISQRCSIAVFGAVFFATRKTHRPRTQRFSDAAPKTRAALEGRWLHVAPMMDYTDRHMRCLMRLLSEDLILWTEMIKDQILTCNAENVDILRRYLDYSSSVFQGESSEHPVVLQLGGSDPTLLAEAVRISNSWGFDEINLNCGCPSPKTASIRNESGFGAQLMSDPELVRDCTEAMAAAAAPGVAVSVKCRIGTHKTLEDLEQEGDNFERLIEFIDSVSSREAPAVNRFIVHARSGILTGLSPRSNRRVPPLRHDLVLELAEKRPDLEITLNGGIKSLKYAEEIRRKGLEVMIGRWALKEPWALAAANIRKKGRGWLLEQYLIHCKTELEAGTARSIWVLLKPLVELFNGVKRCSEYRERLRVSQKKEEKSFLILRDILQDAVSCLPSDALEGEAGDYGYADNG
eukprot:TRINITY_DN5839_c0_g1_i2.p1 TRINITY_DN5839_c0_g1~~TRINITY_DN5839_c0_g1_i2.p1  ORF type:complete len:444 (-),score=59.98 TRINITY_DN5839_c0_g1_i2:109-1440(-)